MGLSAAAVAEGGNRQVRAAEKENRRKGIPRRMDPQLEGGRAGIGGKRRTHRHGAGLL